MSSKSLLNISPKSIDSVLNIAPKHMLWKRLKLKNSDLKENI